MIVGVGCDIVEHQEIRELGWEFDADVLNRIFSANEIALYVTTKDLKFLAGRFAIKEAVLKCLGCGMIDGISLKDIQTLQAQNGLPNLKLLGEVKTIAAGMRIDHWHISITHSSTYSFAFAIAENRIG